jgi:hypothetical protein
MKRGLWGMPEVYDEVARAAVKGCEVRVSAHLPCVPTDVYETTFSSEYETGKSLADKRRERSNGA